jgi:NDP-sugar pyrophosphorylase family protein
MNLPRRPDGRAPGGPAIAERALVLTAGLGTRLRPLSDIRAKAAVPVNGETLVRRVIRWLAGQGVRDLVLNLHHLPATIAASVGDGSDLGARVRYTWEQPVLGSAGGPRRALPLLLDPTDPALRAPLADPRSRTPDPDTFLIVNGDTLTDVDLEAMLAYHQRCGAAVTMALIPNPRPDKYGGVQVSRDGRVTGFTRRGQAGESWHFIGVQIAAARVFAALQDGVPAETVNDLYPRLIAQEPAGIAAFRCAASFRDIGTPADYLATSTELAALEGDRMACGARVRVDDSARVVRTAVWDDVTIGPGSVLEDCIVADGVQVPGGARYTRCAIIPAGTRAAAPDERLDGELLIRPID